MGDPKKIVFSTSDTGLKKGDLFQRKSANASQVYRVVRLMHVDKTGAAHYEGVVVE